MTKLQRDVFLAVATHHARGQWYRAASSGQRVTLASLSRAGVLVLAEEAAQALRQALTSNDPSTATNDDDEK